MVLARSSDVECGIGCRVCSLRSPASLMDILDAAAVVELVHQVVRDEHAAVGGTLEVPVERPALVVDTAGETVNDRRDRRVSYSYAVVLVDDTVGVVIQILEVTGDGSATNLLDGRVVDLVLIVEVTEDNITEVLSDSPALLFLPRKHRIGLILEDDLIM